MSNTNNLVAQFYLAYHENNIDRITNILADNYTGEVNGKEITKKDGITNINNFMEAFPDVKFTVHETIQDGKKIAARWTCTGSHWGPFLGMAPTDRSININGMTIFEVGKNHIERIWTNYDLNSLLKQLRD